MILTCLVIAIAAGGMATTTAKSSIFFRLRWEVAAHSEKGEQLVNCPYCLAHWFVFVACAIYQPRLIGGSFHLIGVVITAFAIVTVACGVAALLVRGFWAD